MEAFKIKVPKGYEIDKDKSTFENIVFKETPKDITERIRTEEDILNILGEQDIEVIDFRKLVEADVSEPILNHQLAVCFAKALNEGHIFNWNDSSEYKYFIYKNMKDNTLDVFYFSWMTYSSTRLCFKNEKLANFAKNTFPKIYHSYLG